LLVFLAATATFGVLAGPAERTAAGELAGFSGRGVLAIRTTVSGSPATFNATISLDQRGTLYRLDILSVTTPGGGSGGGTGSATQLIAPGGLTAVYDRAGRRVTIWSPSRRTYAVYEIPRRAADGAASAASGASADGAGDDGSVARRQLGILGVLAQLGPSSAVLSQAGHGSANGHATTLLDYVLRGAQDGRGNPLDVRGRLQLADDLDGIPVELTATVTGGANVYGTLRADLTSVERTTPSAALFTVPAGYTKVQSVDGVLGRRSLYGHGSGRAVTAAIREPSGGRS
jgi:hypothetical protein